MADDASPGALALRAFAVALDAPSPEQAMLLACRSLEQRVQAAGWPLSLESYVRAFGIKVFEAPIGQAGRLDFEDDGYVIRVKPSQPDQRAQIELDAARTRGRQRFSIAHELGHALLMERLAQQPAHLSGLHDPETWARIEQLCDRAAAELLVPLETFLGGIEHTGIEPEIVDGFAHAYAVSREVILRRFLDVGARAVVLWTVRAVAGKDLLRGSVRSALSGPDGPYFAVGVDSRCMTPNIVVRAARAGRARSAGLAVRRGVARWTLSGVAQTNHTISEEGQPAETQVLLLVLPGDAAERSDPLWRATDPRRRSA